ncbi:hypothetical protein J5TS2_43540 [Brevibacillus halotolerans]|uniref:Uncharacterized protein n=1 Tax=Brevibacillus laterosporus TaxID=1465 RepID=A0A0F7BZ89_BRELA|nr:hypothetical protein EX87_05265 [Brevibacillus laterosporus]GIO03686.1 hypothetical protein J5TS2_43540 [Brevibacillus halotolerans]
MKGKIDYPITWIRKLDKATGNDRNFHLVSTNRNIEEMSLLSKIDKTGILQKDYSKICRNGEL